MSDNRVIKFSGAMKPPAYIHTEPAQFCATEIEPKRRLFAKRPSWLRRVAGALARWLS